MPAYFHPSWASDAWAALDAAPSATVGLVVVNPASGPGAAPDEAYRSLCTSPRLRNVVAGYVDSAYGGRPLMDVLADADAYRRFYGIGSIFVDQVTSGPQGLPYYRELGTELRRRGPCRLVLNPGVVPQQEYLDLADVVVTFEGPWTAYRRHVPPIRAITWHLVHSTPVEHHLPSFRMAAARGASYAYVTERTMPNPWDGLPASWRALTDHVAESGRAG